MTGTALRAAPLVHKAPARVARSLIYGAHCFAPHLVRLVRVAFKRLADLTLSGGMIGDAARDRCVQRRAGLLGGGFSGASFIRGALDDEGTLAHDTRRGRA